MSDVAATGDTRPMDVPREQGPGRPPTDDRHGKRQRSHAGWIRLVLVLAIVSFVCFPTLLVLAWFNFAGGQLGWIPSLVAFSGLGLVTAWLAVSSRWRTARRRASIGLAVIGGIFGIAVAHWAPPTAGRLRHEIEAVVQPGWRMSDETVDGDASCLDTCTTVSQVYRVGASVDDVLQQLRPVLASHGLQLTPGFDRGPLYMFNRGDGGDFHLSAEIQRDMNGGTVVSITARASG
jgi:hypothetical protein